MRMGSPLSDAFALATSHAATWLAGAQPPRVRSARPPLPFLLYEFEACPFCRRVREALEALDLEAEIRPCPKGGRRFRSEAVARGGRAQFPYLLDPNTSAALYESSDIVSYLFERYALGGARPSERPAWKGSIQSALRGARGMAVRPSRAAAVPLIFTGAESNPEARLVRELLCELELAHITRRGDPNGSPALQDGNASASAVGWRSIREHLERCYAI
jgi:glutaredoxin